MASVRVLRIFLSSPGDVVEERHCARDAIAELQREPQFEAVKLEAVSWDDPHGRTPLVAQFDPQTAVERGLPKPSQCDAVVGIFWARMGSPLPADKYQKTDGSPYLSGTEYELEDAFGPNPGPDVLLYRRSEVPLWSARDPEWSAKLEQLARLDAFLEILKAAPRYVDAYPTPAELKERLKNDLRKILARKLPSTAMAEGFQQAPPAPVADDRLAQAEARLAAMPLDVVPAPAALPAGSHMPLARNALFVGREADLKALALALKAGETAAVGQIAAATGLGGIGKTQLASEFVHRYGQYFQGGVFWLSFADPEAVPAEIATCGGPGAMKLRDDFGALSLNDQVQLVAAEWQNPLPRLLVFDNCEDEALLASWRPRAGGCRVLVTSRREIWSLHLGVHALSLGVLQRPESLALLRSHRPDLAPDDPPQQRRRRARRSAARAASRGQLSRALPARALRPAGGLSRSPASPRPARASLAHPSRHLPDRPRAPRRAHLRAELRPAAAGRPDRRHGAPDPRAGGLVRARRSRSRANCFGTAPGSLRRTSPRSCASRTDSRGCASWG